LHVYLSGVIKLPLTLTPVDDGDICFTPVMFDKINRSIKHLQQGMIAKLEMEEERKQILNSL